MTDVVEQYYEDRRRASMTDLPASTFITPDGVDVEVVPPEDALGEGSMMGGTESRDLVEDVTSVGAGIAEGVESLAAGAVLGAENINALIPGAEALVGAASEVIEGTPLDIRPEVGPGIGDALMAGLGQAIPGIVPATRLLKTLGATSRIGREIVGGFLGDVATSSEMEAQGLIDAFQSHSPKSRICLAKY